jgi:hypothetical protein
LSALSEVLTEFARRGISMRIVGAGVRLSPKAALDTSLLARARAVKCELVRMLSSRPATCSKECYEVEAGRWIHRPWAGCTTSQAIAAEAPREMEELVCWHCLGTKRCSCAGGCHEAQDTCAVCRGLGRVRGWIQ